MSKTITIKRKPNKTNLPDHIYESAKRKIGSTFSSSGDVNTGLTLTETQKYMPPILGVSDSDPSFYKQVKEWFMNLSIEVPAQGVDFEIDTDKAGNPINVMDYIKYKFSSSHPYVLIDSTDKDELRRKRRHTFIVEDKSREKVALVAAKDARKKALASYIKVSADKEKMIQVLRVLGEYPDSMDAETQEITLEKLANENPTLFYATANNSDLSIKAFIRNCLSAEVLRKVGNTYLDGEEALGNSEEEVVLFLKDKRNSETLVTLKARLKQFK